MFMSLELYNTKTSLCNCIDYRSFIFYNNFYFESEYSEKH